MGTGSPRVKHQPETARLRVKGLCVRSRIATSRNAGMLFGTRNVVRAFVGRRQGCAMQVEIAVGIARRRDRQITAPKVGRNWGWHKNLFPEVLHPDPCFPVQQQHAPKASIGPSLLQDNKGVRGRDRKEASIASVDTRKSGKATSRRQTHWRQVDVAAGESRDSALSVRACRWKCSVSPGSPPHTLSRDSPLSLCFPSSTIVCSP